MYIFFRYYAILFKKNLQMYAFTLMKYGYISYTDSFYTNNEHHCQFFMRRKNNNETYRFKKMLNILQHIAIIKS